MNRNVESHFAINPTNIDISRSTFDRSSSLKTSWNVGDIIPFYIDEVLPGDTFKVKTSKVVRMQSLMTPIMDNIYLDTYYFFVPNRLVWNHWKEFNGENTQSAWLPEVQYQVPQLTSPPNGWNVGTIADYFGVPTGVKNLSVNALPFRAYALIMNEWFRDQNLCDPLLVPVTDATVAGSNGGTFVSDVAKGGKPYKAAKYHDYFTSCLPSPQKGPDVKFDLGITGDLPVIAKDTLVGTSQYSMHMKFTPSGGVSRAGRSGVDLTQQAYHVLNVVQDAMPGMIEEGGFVPDNLWAVNSGAAPAITINELRTAFAIQRMYEKDARGGTRYIEILKSHFGVTSPDSRLQRPEYLGGNRVPITVNQVTQQSETSTTPQGTVTGMSLTTDVNEDFTKSFTEHGFVIGLCVCRYDHTYQQGLERMWSRKNRFDYYWPVFANIGEQAVLNKEIFAQGSNVQSASTGKPVDDEVFGYQEAWADYRYKPNRVSGMMRSTYSQSLDAWHLGDDYATLPHLSEEWIFEDGELVDRVLAVSSRNTDQLFGDFYINCRCTRAMPLYSIPGLIDHH